VQVINVCIELLLYLCIAGSAMYLGKGSWEALVEQAQKQFHAAQQRRALRTASFYATRAVKFRKLRAEQHLRDLLEASLKEVRRHTFARFLWGSALLGAVVFLFDVLLMHRWVLGVGLGLVFGAIPYATLFVRKRWNSIRNSYDITVIIDKLLPKYRRAQKDMLRALSYTLEELPDTAFKDALMRLTIRLQRYQTVAEVHEAIRAFNVTTGTVWAIRLSQIIGIAVLDRVDVESSLVHMEEDLVKVQAELKSQNMDRFDTLLLGVTPILILPLLLFYLQSNVTRHTLQFQFDTPQGITHFSVALVFCFIGLSVAVLFYKPKQDI
jgi:hypothetical protein